MNKIYADGIDLSEVMAYGEKVRLSELSELALLASAGAQAIDLFLKQQQRRPSRLCSELATQALMFIRRVPALESHKSVFEHLSKGLRPKQDLSGSRGLMRLVAGIYRAQYKKKEKVFDQLRGVRSCQS